VSLAAAYYAAFSGSVTISKTLAFPVHLCPLSVFGGSSVICVLWSATRQVGQQIEVRPGIVTKDSNGRAFSVPLRCSVCQTGFTPRCACVVSGAFKCIPLVSTVVSLCAEQNELQYAVPGGLIGVGTMIDPMLTRADRLMGQVRLFAGVLFGPAKRSGGIALA